MTRMLHHSFLTPDRNYGVERKVVQTDTAIVLCPKELDGMNAGRSNRHRGLTVIDHGGGIGDLLALAGMAGNCIDRRTLQMDWSRKLAGREITPNCGQTTEGAA